MPVGGPGGSLAQLANVSAARRVYIHINNTNPILLEDSPERRLLDRHGMQVAADGLELHI